MFWIANLAFIYRLVALGIIGVTRSVFAALVKPALDLSPTCGSAEPGINKVRNTNGFSPNGTVAWKFVGSDSKIPLYGYFETNSTGGFNNVTFADDLKPDDYKMHLADVDSDGTLETAAVRVYAKITVLCKQLEIV